MDSQKKSTAKPIAKPVAKPVAKPMPTSRFTGSDEMPADIKREMEDAEQQRRNDAGAANYLKEKRKQMGNVYKCGGKVKMAKGGSVCRGSGAATKGVKFKGVM